MESPITYESLEDGQLKAKFDSLLACTRTVPSMTEEELIALFERILHEVTITKTPNLVKILPRRTKVY